MVAIYNKEPHCNSYHIQHVTSHIYRPYVPHPPPPTKFQSVEQLEPTIYCRCFLSTFPFNTVCPSCDALYVLWCWKSSVQKYIFFICKMCFYFTTDKFALISFCVFMCKCMKFDCDSSIYFEDIESIKDGVVKCSDTETEPGCRLEKVCTLIYIYSMLKVCPLYEQCDHG